MIDTLVRVVGCNRIGRQKYSRAEVGPHLGSVIVTELKRVAGHCCAQLKIVSRAGREAQRGIINST